MTMTRFTQFEIIIRWTEKLGVHPQKGLHVHTFKLWPIYLLPVIAKIMGSIINSTVLKYRTYSNMPIRTIFVPANFLTLIERGMLVLFTNCPIMEFHPNYMPRFPASILTGE